MRIGDEVYVHGYIDEICKDSVIIRNDGGYFGTVKEEIVSGELRTVQDVNAVIDRMITVMEDVYRTLKVNFAAHNTNRGDYLLQIDALEDFYDRWKLKIRDLREEIESRMPKTDAKAPQREFVGLVVEYPPEDLCTYPEYKGKPYYSIKYVEDGDTFVGYGTYKPEVLSRYIKEYFIEGGIHAND